MLRHFLCTGVCVTFASTAFAAKPAAPRPIPGLRIGPETTVVSSPLNEVGYPDYVAALNQKLSEGVRPEENFWAAYCETLPRSEVVDQYFKQLITLPGFERACSIPCEAYHSAGDNAEAANKQLETSMNRPWKKEELPLIASWLDKNREALARVTEATTRPKAYAPLITMDGSHLMMNVLLPHVQQTRDSARALSARAFLAIGEARGEDAWKDVLTLHRLARHNQNSPFLIGNLVGIAISAIARIPTQVCLTDPSVSSDDLLKRWKELSAIIGPESRPLVWVDGERFSTLDITLALRSGRTDADELLGAFTSLTDGSMPPNDGPPEMDFRNAQKAFQSMMLKLGDVNDTLVFINAYYDRIFDAISKSEHRDRQSALKEIADEYQRGPSSGIGSAAAAFFLGGPDAVERMAHGEVINLFAAAFEQCNKAEARAIGRNRLLHAAFAGELQYRKTGRDVADSNELNLAIREFSLAAGVELSNMQDPYSGDAFRIASSAEQLVLYAIGDNLRSDGGKTFGEGEGCDDIAVVLKR